MKSLIQLRKKTPLFASALLLVGLALRVAPTAFGVVPPPDGGYPNFTTAEGHNALKNLTTGSANTAVGWFSLGSLTTGSFNTATGAGALLFNTADQNTAFGAAALLFNTIGADNVAIGAQALVFNSDGDFNTAVGTQALSSNTIGLSNTAVGAGALFSNTEGHQNVAIGNGALLSNTTGILNIALGWNAGRDLTTGNNNIDIFNTGEAGDDGTIRIGSTSLQTATYIAGISGATASGGAAVFVAADGKLGTLTSSARFKDEIKPMDEASEAILALKPVTFRYKKEVDPNSIPQFGLVAEDVAKVNPDLVARDAKGELYTVRYEAVNAMLLNEFLKEHRKNEEQEKTIAELKSEMTALIGAVKKQAAQIQKVSAQLEASKFATRRIRRGGPAPHSVANNP
jgi:Chaperone of endosialidase